MSKLIKIILCLFPVAAVLFVFMAITTYSAKPIEKNINSNSKVAGSKIYNLGPENTFNLSNSAPTNSTLESLTAQSVYIYDLTNKKTLFAKNPNDKIPVASTLKILTGALSLDNSSTNTVFTVSQKAAEVGEDSMQLSQDEKMTVEDLLYGLMLPSGNDAAVTLAEGTAGTEQNFVDVMNQKAVKIGMNNSFFVNASGLEGDGNDYSTARDMTQLAAYVWQNYSLMQKISGKYNYNIEATENHKEFDLYNETNLLTTYPGVKGFKPGFTPKAGFCLITVAEINGHDVIITMLNSVNRREEMRQVLDNLKNIIQ